MSKDWFFEIKVILKLDKVVSEEKYVGKSLYFAAMYHLYLQTFLCEVLKLFHFFFYLKGIKFFGYSSVNRLSEEEMNRLTLRKSPSPQTSPMLQKTIETHDILPVTSRKVKQLQTAKVNSNLLSTPPMIPSDDQNVHTFVSSRNKC